MNARGDWFLADGQIAEATNLESNQDSASALFWSADRLEPLPDRLERRARPGWDQSP